MSTGVVINGYEIQNWHTVSILELHRARKTQERDRELVQPAPVAKPRKKTKRSNDMPKKARELSAEEKHIICTRYQKGKSIKDLARQYHVGLPRIRKVLAEGGVETRKRGFNISTASTPDHLEPPYLADLVAEAAAELAGDEQMDDPEMTVRPAPVVLEVMELETRPRLPYMPPAIVRTGSLKPATVMPEIQTMRVNTLEQLPRLAELVRDLKSIEGVNVAGSISVSLSIEAEL